MFCRLRQCRQILPKLNLSAILLLFLIKRAALGNLKVNFHCAHWHRFFPLKEALSKPTSPPLNLKFFLKSTRPSLPLKKAPPLISVFSPQGRRGKPPSGARNRFTLWLSDHQRSAPCCAGWDRLGITLFSDILLVTCRFLAFSLVVSQKMHNFAT